MADQLYLSLWLRDFTEDNMLRHFGKLLDTFPFSKLRPGIAALSIYALEFVEPPLVAQAYTKETSTETVLQAASEFRNADCAYLVDGWWELWQFDGEWRLQPARVSFECHGPEFTSDVGDHLRIALGLDTWFVPQPKIPGSGITIQSNIKSLLRLVKDLSDALPVEHRRLWLESGDDFSARLAAGLKAE
jgi:hypothetical protein